MKKKTVRHQIITLGSMLLVLSTVLHGNVIAGGCEPLLPESTPNDRFEIPVNETVRDKETGLMWKQCLQGLAGADCETGQAEELTWMDALQTASSENFAGYQDWRLANKNELLSIVENRCYTPSINSDVFPNVRLFNHWSSTPAYEHTTAEKAVRVAFDTGNTHNQNINGNESVFRLVRGGR